MSRLHVHFSTELPSEDRAVSGIRTTCDVLIFLNIAKCIAEGLDFYKSENGVILSPGNAEGYITSAYFLKITDRNGIVVNTV